MLALAAAVCATAAEWGYARFRTEPQQLCRRMDHDRNTHSTAGPRLGLDLRQGGLVDVLADVHRLRTWPLQHACRVAITTFIVQTGYPRAVLFTLAARCGGMLLPFLIGSRAACPGGTLAGTTAARWMLTSPAHRAFAGDLMPKALGAMLTLLVVQACLAARSCGPGMSRMLAVWQTLLFCAKYNYWLLALAAVGCCKALRQRGNLYSLAAAKRSALGRWLVQWWRRRLSWLVPALASLCLVSRAHGPQPKMVCGGLRPGGMSQNLWHLAFLALVALTAAHWRNEVAHAWVRLPPGCRAYALWHLVPAAAWFLPPERLGYLVWHLSLENGPNSGGGLWSSLSSYWECVQKDYHTTTWSLAAAAGLALAAFVRPRLRPGPGMLLALPALVMVLAATHANFKSRFVHTWPAAAWAAVRVGLACLAGWYSQAGTLAACRWVVYGGWDAGDGRTGPGRTAWLAGQQQLHVREFASGFKPVAAVAAMPPRRRAARHRFQSARRRLCHADLSAQIERLCA